jgi:hypothetical protein
LPAIRNDVCLIHDLFRFHSQKNDADPIKQFTDQATDLGTTSAMSMNLIN